MNKQNNSSDGFILLRELLTMFMVIVCFASALTAMTVFVHHGSRLLENIKTEINRQNETILRQFSNEKY
ncbi:MAG: hypothetical protein LBU88_06975 [Treponema sp.]|nr:hypothetical protein [Treponema sp.]